MKKICLSLLLFITCVMPGAAWATADQFNIEEADRDVSGDGWNFKFDTKILTVGNGANIIVTGEVDDGRRIVVSTMEKGEAANITLNGVSITMPAGSSESPLLLTSGANLILTLEGENTLKAMGYSAGIQAPEGTTLTIKGLGMGTLEATGGYYNGGAGIGGGGGEAGGTINILSGVVTAEGNAGGAGIGGGDGKAGGEINISGGIVTATSGTGTAAGAGIGGGGSNGEGGTITINGGTVEANSAYGAGIGGGQSVTDSGTLAMVGDGVVIAKIQIVAGLTMTNGILFDGGVGTMYGSVTPKEDFTIPVSNNLTIGKNQTLTINSGVTMTNEGGIENDGTINNNGMIDNNGAINNNGTIYSRTGGIAGNAPTGNPVIYPPEPYPPSHGQAGCSAAGFALSALALLAVATGRKRP